jgi:hypothetical protein
MSDYVSFSTEVVCSKSFLSLPIKAQGLYFLLCAEANRSGKLNNVHTLARVNSCSQKEIDSLLENKYLAKTEKDFEYILCHWDINNGFNQSKERRTSEYHQWRNSVIKRDKKCVVCGKDKELHAHHIKPFAKYPELRTVLSNGITLCKTCHRKMHRKEKTNG